MHLYELTNTYVELTRILDDTDAQEVDESIGTAIEQIDGKIEDKLENIVKVVKGFEAMAKARKEEAAKMVERAKHAENIAARIKEYVAFQVERMEPESKKKSAGLFTLTVANNGGKQPINIHEEDVPMEWKKATFRPDLDLIRKHLEAGDPLGFAQLVPRGTHLRIR